MIVELNTENFTKETSNGLKLVDFYTTWCKFCSNQEPILDELSESGIWIGKLDCDKFPDIAKKYGVSGFPSFILFKNGVASAQFAGFHTKSQMLNKLTSYLP
ncbi:thioredoxin family protein [bacterium]|nr:thioredoxin family protein [bacterium]